MKYSQFVEDLRKEFYACIEIKTNWGKEQLKLEFERATIRVLARYLEGQWKGLQRRIDADTK